MQAHPGRAPARVLILKPSSLGDVVQALPVLRLIKQRHPRAQVHWWIDSSLAPLLEGDPDLEGVIRFERKRWARPIHWNEMLASIRHMRRHNFDWVIDLQSLARSGAFAWLAKGSLLVGLDDAREGARGFYDIVVRRASRQTHAVDWYLAVLPHLAVPVHKRFTWLPERPAVAASIREKFPGEGVKWICLIPGARWENKRWPVERFAGLARRLANADGAVRFAVLGGRDDQAMGTKIVAAVGSRCVDLTGQTSLPEMVEWVRRCSIVVTNDTGPMHVAAALGRPIVALFGPTDPRRTGPYGQANGVLNHALPCAPCMESHCAHEPKLECMLRIEEDTVFSEVQWRLSSTMEAAVSG